MKNNIITYSDLKCPSVQLKCVLEDLFCSLIAKPGCLNFEMALSPAPSNNLIITVGGVTHTINLSTYLEDAKIQSFTLNDLTGLVTITQSDGTSFTVNISNAVKNAETKTTVINTVTGHKIADYSNEAGVLFPINETVTTSSKTSANTLRITNEAGANTDHTLVSTNTLTVDANNDLVSTINGVASTGLDLSAIVKAGETVTTITNTKVGNKIADYTNEAGAVVPLNETITTSSKVGANTLRITNETGTATDLTLIGSNVLSIVGTDLVSTVNGIASTALDLSTIVKAEETITTITSTITGHKIADYTNEAGTLVTLNESISTISLTGSTATFTNEAGDSTTFEVATDIVNNATQNALNLKVDKTSLAGTTNYVAKFTSSSSIGDSQIFDNGVGVGIGTTSPVTKLNIVASPDATFNSQVMIGDGANTAQKIVFNSSVSSGISGLTDGAMAFYAYAANTERMRISANGNLGIATSTPAHKLTIQGDFFVGSSFNGQSINDASAERIRIGYKDGLPDVGIIPAQIIANTNVLQFASRDIVGGAITFATGSGIPERLRISNTGNVLIGTTVDSGYKLDVNGSLRSTNDAYFATTSGNVGIGTTTPTSKLQVVGLPVYETNAAAVTGGLTEGAFYRNSIGDLKVVF